MAPAGAILVIALFTVSYMQPSQTVIFVSGHRNAFIHYLHSGKVFFSILRCIADYLALLLTVQGIEPNPGPLSHGSFEGNAVFKKRQPGAFPGTKGEKAPAKEDPAQATIACLDKTRAQTATCRINRPQSALASVTPRKAALPSLDITKVKSAITYLERKYEQKPIATTVSVQKTHGPARPALSPSDSRVKAKNGKRSSVSPCGVNSKAKAKVGKNSDSDKSADSLQRDIDILFRRGPHYKNYKKQQARDSSMDDDFCINSSTESDTDATSMYSLSLDDTLSTNTTSDSAAYDDATSMHSLTTDTDFTHSTTYSSDLDDFDRTSMGSMAQSDDSVEDICRPASSKCRPISASKVPSIRNKDQNNDSKASANHLDNDRPSSKSSSHGHNGKPSDQPSRRGTYYEMHPTAGSSMDDFFCVKFNIESDSHSDDSGSRMKSLSQNDTKSCTKSESRRVSSGDVQGGSRSKSLSQNGDSYTNSSTKSGSRNVGSGDVLNGSHIEILSQNGDSYTKSSTKSEPRNVCSGDVQSGPRSKSLSQNGDSYTKSSTKSESRRVGRSDDQSRSHSRSMSQNDDSYTKSSTLSESRNVGSGDVQSGSRTKSLSQNDDSYTKSSTLSESRNVGSGDVQSGSRTKSLSQNGDSYTKSSTKSESRRVGRSDDQSRSHSRSMSQNDDSYTKSSTLSESRNVGSGDVQSGPRIKSVSQNDNNYTKSSTKSECRNVGSGDVQSGSRIKSLSQNDDSCSNTSTLSENSSEASDDVPTSDTHIKNLSDKNDSFSKEQNRSALSSEESGNETDVPYDSDFDEETVSLSDKQNEEVVRKPLQRVYVDPTTDNDTDCSDYSEWDDRMGAWGQTNHKDEVHAVDDDTNLLDDNSLPKQDHKASTSEKLYSRSSSAKVACLVPDDATGVSLVKDRADVTHSPSHREDDMSGANCKEDIIPRSTSVNNVSSEVAGDSNTPSKDKSETSQPCSSHQDSCSLSSQEHSTFTSDKLTRSSSSASNVRPASGDFTDTHTYTRTRTSTRTSTRSYSKDKELNSAVVSTNSDRDSGTYTTTSSYSKKWDNVHSVHSAATLSRSSLSAKSARSASKSDASQVSDWADVTLSQSYREGEMYGADYMEDYVPRLTSLKKVLPAAAGDSNNQNTSEASQSCSNHRESNSLSSQEHSTFTSDKLTRSSSSASNVRHTSDDDTDTHTYTRTRSSSRSYSKDRKLHSDAVSTNSDRDSATYTTTRSYTRTSSSSKREDEVHAADSIATFSRTSSSAKSARSASKHDVSSVSDWADLTLSHSYREGEMYGADYMEDYIHVPRYASLKKPSPAFGGDSNAVDQEESYNFQRFTNRLDDRSLSIQEQSAHSSEKLTRSSLSAKSARSTTKSDVSSVSDWADVTLSHSYREGEMYGAYYMEAYVPRHISLKKGSPALADDSNAADKDTSEKTEYCHLDSRSVSSQEHSTYTSDKLTRSSLSGKDERSKSDCDTDITSGSNRDADTHSNSSSYSKVDEVHSTDSTVTLSRNSSSSKSAGPVSNVDAGVSLVSDSMDMTLSHSYREGEMYGADYMEEYEPRYISLTKCSPAAAGDSNVADKEKSEHSQHSVNHLNDQSLSSQEQSISSVSDCIDMTLSHSYREGEMYGADYMEAYIPRYTSQKQVSPVAACDTNAVDKDTSEQSVSSAILINDHSLSSQEHSVSSVSDWADVTLSQSYREGEMYGADYMETFIPRSTSLKNVSMAVSCDSKELDNNKKDTTESCTDCIDNSSLVPQEHVASASESLTISSSSVKNACSASDDDTDISTDSDWDSDTDTGSHSEHEDEEHSADDSSTLSRSTSLTRVSSTFSCGFNDIDKDPSELSLSNTSTNQSDTSSWSSEDSCTSTPQMLIRRSTSIKGAWTIEAESVVSADDVDTESVSGDVVDSVLDDKDVNEPDYMFLYMSDDESIASLPVDNDRIDSQFNIYDEAHVVEDSEQSAKHDVPSNIYDEAHDVVDREQSAKHDVLSNIFDEAHDVDSSEQSAKHDIHSNIYDEAHDVEDNEQSAKHDVPSNIYDEAHDVEDNEQSAKHDIPSNIYDEAHDVVDREQSAKHDVLSNIFDEAHDVDSSEQSAKHDIHSNIYDEAHDVEDNEQSAKHDVPSNIYDEAHDVEDNEQSAKHDIHSNIYDEAHDVDSSEQSAKHDVPSNIYDEAHDVEDNEQSAKQDIHANIYDEAHDVDSSEQSAKYDVPSNIYDEAHDVEDSEQSDKQDIHSNIYDEAHDVVDSSEHSSHDVESVLNDGVESVSNDEIDSVSSDEEVYESDYMSDNDSIDSLPFVGACGECSSVNDNYYDEGNLTAEDVESLPYDDIDDGSMNELYSQTKCTYAMEDGELYMDDNNVNVTDIIVRKQRVKFAMVDDVRYFDEDFENTSIAESIDEDNEDISIAESVDSLPMEEAIDSLCLDNSDANSDRVTNQHRSHFEETKPKEAQGMPTMMMVPWTLPQAQCMPTMMVVPCQMMAPRPPQQPKDSSSKMKVSRTRQPTNYVSTQMMAPSTPRQTMDVSTQMLSPSTPQQTMDVSTQVMVPSTPPQTNDVFTQMMAPSTPKQTTDVSTKMMAPSTPQQTMDVSTQVMVPSTPPQTNDVFTQMIAPSTPKQTTDVSTKMMVPSTPPQTNDVSTEMFVPSTPLQTMDVSTQMVATNTPGKTMDVSTKMVATNTPEKTMDVSTQMVVPSMPQQQNDVSTQMVVPCLPQPTKGFSPLTSDERFSTLQDTEDVPSLTETGNILIGSVDSLECIHLCRMGNEVEKKTVRFAEECVVIYYDKNVAGMSEDVSISQSMDDAHIDDALKPAEAWADYCEPPSISRANTVDTGASLDHSDHTPEIPDTMGCESQDVSDKKSETKTANMPDVINELTTSQNMPAQQPNTKVSIKMNIENSEVSLDLSTSEQQVGNNGSVVSSEYVYQPTTKSLDMDLSISSKDGIGKNKVKHPDSSDNEIQLDKSVDISNTSKEVEHLDSLAEDLVKKSPKRQQSTPKILEVAPCVSSYDIFDEEEQQPTLKEYMSTDGVFNETSPSVHQAINNPDRKRKWQPGKTHKRTTEYRHNIEDELVRKSLSAPTICNTDNKQGNTETPPSEKRQATKRKWQGRKRVPKSETLLNKSEHISKIMETPANEISLTSNIKPTKNETCGVSMFYQTPGDSKTQHAGHKKSRIPRFIDRASMKKNNKRHEQGDDNQSNHEINNNNNKTDATSAYEDIKPEYLTLFAPKITKAERIKDKAVSMWTTEKKKDKPLKIVEFLRRFV